MRKSCFIFFLLRKRNHEKLYKIYKREKKIRILKIFQKSHFEKGLEVLPFLSLLKLILIILFRQKIFGKVFIKNPCFLFSESFQLIDFISFCSITDDLIFQKKTDLSETLKQNNFILFKILFILSTWDFFSFFSTKFFQRNHFYFQQKSSY